MEQQIDDTTKVKQLMGEISPLVLGINAVMDKYGITDMKQYFMPIINEGRLTMALDYDVLAKILK